MDSKGRDEADRLEALAELLRRCGCGHFRAAVAFIERSIGARVRPGEDGPFADEPIAFRHDGSLSFSSGDITNISTRRTAGGDVDRPPIEMLTTFLGLTGSVSPLPPYFAEEITQDSGPEQTQRDFLDVFHHRVLSLFYRVTSRYSPAMEFTSDMLDPWTKRFLCIGGIDGFGSDLGTRLPRWRLVQLLPLLVRPTNTAWTIETALTHVLSEYLGNAKVSIQQFVGAWVPIDPAQKIRLGKANSNLGVNTLIGASAYDYGGKIRISVGPLDFADYQRFRSDPAVRNLIDATVALLMRDPLEYDLSLQLGEGALPGLQMSASRPARLGVDTFLGARGEKEVVMPMTSPWQRASVASDDTQISSGASRPA